MLRNQQKYPGAIPPDAMYGRLGKIARTLDAPHAPAYVTLLALYSGQGINLTDPHAEDAPRPNIYAFQLGRAGVGKSVVIDRARRALFYRDDHLMETLSGSDRGLISSFRKGMSPKDEPPPMPHPAVIVVDEGSALLKKMAIEGSALRQMYNTLYYKDYYEASDKRGTVGIRAKISLLANLTLSEPSEFSEHFGNETRDGFLTRLVLAPFPDEWEWDFRWRPLPIESKRPAFLDDEPDEVISHHTEPLMPSSQWNPGLHVMFSGDRHEEAQIWAREMRAADREPGRTLEIAMRIAVISASANGEKEVSAECLAAALKFGEWQTDLRLRYKAGDAKTQEGKVGERLITAFQEVFAAHKAGKPMRAGDRLMVRDGWLRFRDLDKKYSLSRSFGALPLRILDSFARGGVIEEQVEIDPVTKSKIRTGKYRWPLEKEEFEPSQLPGDSLDCVPSARKEPIQ